MVQTRPEQGSVTEDANPGGDNSAASAEWQRFGRAAIGHNPLETEAELFEVGVNAWFVGGQQKE